MSHGQGLKEEQRELAREAAREEHYFLNVASVVITVMVLAFFMWLLVKVLT